MIDVDIDVDVLLVGALGRGTWAVSGTGLGQTVHGVTALGGL